MKDCIFCKIIHGEIPAEKVYEDDVVFAFVDIHPVNKGHTLVIPKKHLENMFVIPKEEFVDLMERVHLLAPKIKAAVGADGINLGMNNDAAAGQLVFHAHIHIIPRFEGDGLKHWRGDGYKEGEMQEVGEKIRKQLA